MDSKTTPENAYILKYGDPRVQKYLLMKNPTATLSLVSAYLLFVKIIAPLWMRSRQPYKLRNIMVIYNLFTSLLNAWLFFQFAFRWITKYRLRCEPIDFSHDEDALKIVQVCWVYFISKFLEFADTIFAVLRKKSFQVSKLHVIHHSITPLLAWYAVKYGPGGYNTFLMTLNSFVHIWMYLYYGFAAIGLKIQKNLWWKKYLTTLQLVQFTASMVFYTQLYFLTEKNCQPSTFLCAINFVPSLFFFVLFIDFYMKAYNKRT